MAGGNVPFGFVQKALQRQEARSNAFESINKVRQARRGSGQAGSGIFTIKIDVNSDEFKIATLKANAALEKLDAKSKITLEKVRRIRKEAAAARVAAAGTGAGGGTNRPGKRGPLGFRTSGIVLRGGLKLGRGGFLLERDEVLNKARGLLAGIAVTQAIGGALNGAANLRDFIAKNENLSNTAIAKEVAAATIEGLNKVVADITAVKSIATGLARLGAGGGPAPSQKLADAAFDRIITDRTTTQLQRNSVAREARRKASIVYVDAIVQIEKTYNKMAATGPKDFRLSGEEGRAIWETDIDVLKNRSQILANAAYDEKMIKEGRAREVFGPGYRGSGAN